MRIWMIALGVLVLVAGSVGAEERGRQAGQITFEQFRMLSTGMTEGQVLVKIGAPLSKVTLSCTAASEKLSPQDRVTTVTCPALWTYSMGDGWTGDLTFVSGRLVDIQNTKSPSRVLHLPPRSALHGMRGLAQCA